MFRLEFTVSISISISKLIIKISKGFGIVLTLRYHKDTENTFIDVNT